MTTLFSSFDKSESAAQGLPRRSLRVAAIVANSWTVFGSGLMFIAPDIPSPLHERLRIFAIGAILIAAAMFSLILPLHFILKADEKQ
jgi:hypothetical protein